MHIVSLTYVASSIALGVARILVLVIGPVGCSASGEPRVLAAAGATTTSNQDRSTPPPPWRSLPVPDYAAAIGTPHPMDVHLTAHNGMWVVACEARTLPPEHARRGPRGNDKEQYSFGLYLFRGGGEGQRIDELVAASPDDRWIVVYRGDELVLIDDREGRETTLFRGVNRTAHGFHQVAAFDGTSRYLVYFRLTDNGSTVTVRNLAEQTERKVAIPDRYVSRILPEPTGSWARLLFAPEGEEDESWRPPLPSVPDEDESELWAICKVPRAAGWRLGYDGEQLWLDIAHATTRSAPQELAHLGSLVIRRNPDGSLAFGDDEVVPAACDATVLGVSSSPPRIIATCAANNLHVPLMLFGPGLSVKIGQAFSMPSLVRFIDTPYACPQLSRVCVAVADGAPVALNGGVGVAGTNVVVLHQHARFFATGPRAGQQLPSDRWKDRRNQRDMHLIGAVVVDLAAERVLGTVPPEPVEIDSAGRALIASGVELQVHQMWWIGPLRWVTPTPVVTTMPAP